MPAALRAPPTVVLAILAALLARPGALPANPADSTAALALELNLPACRLDVLEPGGSRRSFRVAVGTRDHPTPIGRFLVDRVVWNPWWVPPPFDWAAGESVTPPGPDNPTGRVKLYFGRYLFVHGTPAVRSLGTAASHGCVRMDNADAIELARTVHRHASPEVTDAELDALEADPNRTRTIPLATPVTLTVRYERIEVAGDSLLLHPDPYGRIRLGRAEVIEVLAARGIPTGSIDPRRLDRAIEETAGGTVATAIRDLIGTPPRARDDPGETRAAPLDRPERGDEPRKEER